MTQFVYPVINTQDNQDLYFPPLHPPPVMFGLLVQKKKINWKTPDLMLGLCSISCARRPVLRHAK